MDAVKALGIVEHGVKTTKLSIWTGSSVEIGPSHRGTRPRPLRILRDSLRVGVAAVWRWAIGSKPMPWSPGYGLRWSCLFIWIGTGIISGKARHRRGLNELERSRFAHLKHW